MQPNPWGANIVQTFKEPSKVSESLHGKVLWSGKRGRIGADWKPEVKTAIFFWNLSIGLPTNEPDLYLSLRNTRENWDNSEQAQRYRAP